MSKETLEGQLEDLEKSLFKTKGKSMVKQLTMALEDPKNGTNTVKVKLSHEFGHKELKTETIKLKKINIELVLSSVILGRIPESGLKPIAAAITIIHAECDLVVYNTLLGIFTKCHKTSGRNSAAFAIGIYELVKAKSKTE